MTLLQKYSDNPQVTEQFSEFRDSMIKHLAGIKPPFNRTIATDESSFYCRFGHYLFEGELKACICLANLQVNPDYQNKGIFSEFLAKIIQLAEEFNVPIIVENVFGPQLKQYLDNRPEMFFCKNSNGIDTYFSVKKG